MKGVCHDRCRQDEIVGNSRAWTSQALGSPMAYYLDGLPETSGSGAG